jgi:hypothetical protein
MHVIFPHIKLSIYQFINLSIYQFIKVLIQLKKKSITFGGEEVVVEPPLPLMALFDKDSS